MCFLNALTPGSSLIQKSDLSFSKQTWNGKKFVSSQFQVKWKWNGNGTMFVCCEGWRGKKCKKPDSKANLKAKRRPHPNSWSGADLLVYKTQWSLEHWLRMSECLGLPRATSWNVDRVCLCHIWETSSWWQRFGVRRMWVLKGWMKLLLLMIFSVFSTYLPQVGSNNHFMFNNPDSALVDVNSSCALVVCCPASAGSLHRCLKCLARSFNILL